jgi:hypothetical protein
MTLETGRFLRMECFYTDDGTGNICEAKDFGFDSLVARRTVTDYWHETHPAYAALNLTGLPSSVSVRDGAGAEASRTAYRYDKGWLTSCGGTIVNHEPAYGALYTTRGNVSAIHRYYQERGRYVVSTMAYDILGNMLSCTDPRGNTTTISHAPSSSGIHALVRSVSNALGQVTQYKQSALRQLPLRSAASQGEKDLELPGRLRLAADRKRALRLWRRRRDPGRVPQRIGPMVWRADDAL